MVEKVHAHSLYQVNSYLLVLMEGNDLVTKAAGAGGGKMNRR